MTVSQLITAALQDLRVLQVGETASANDAAYGLDRLNDWIDSLATEGLTVYSRARTLWTISAATSYTIGTGATINCARPTGPLAIDNVGFQDTSVSPTIEYNLGPVSWWRFSRMAVSRPLRCSPARYCRSSAFA